MDHLIIEGFLLLFIIFREVLSYKERKDLYARLMAKNLTEHTISVVEEKKAKVPEKIKSEFVPV